MTSRERVRALLARQEADRVGFWMGNPHGDSWPALIAAFAAKESVAVGATGSPASGDASMRVENGYVSGGGPIGLQLEVRDRLGDDFRWISPEWLSYRHPEGRPIFEIRRRARSLSSPAAFSDAESVAEVDDFPWPNPDYLDFTACIALLEATGPVYRASGFWCPFFHIVADFFGMDNYFIKMYTNPDVVHAVTRHVVDFYLEANRRFFAQAGDLVDGFFFGNDFGTQLDLLISPDCFREFVFPYFRQLTEQGHEHGYQVILHSCGSIYKVIPDLLELGVDALHPLQARAVNMEAERLASDFGGAVTFIGGVDTQDLLVNGTPDQVRADVARLIRVLGPHLVVSPSHEALLPNVPPENVLAMAEAAGSA